jgi:TrmH family RNA methyltransferase
MTEVISSAANPLVKRVRALADRRHRRRESAFVVQGVQPVWQAVEAGADIDVLLVAPELLRHHGSLDMVSAQEARGVRVARLTGELFARISDRDGPAGLAAIVRATLTRVGDLAVPEGGLFAALHEPGNPGNVGTIIRTANAAGASAVILIGPSADPFDPVAVKASMGALFTMPVAVAESGAEFLAWATAAGVTVAATSGRSALSCWDATWQFPLTLLLGSEGTGLPADLLAAADMQVSIPMTGTAESLNLAVAAGVLLYEVRRSTRSATPSPPATGSVPGE